MAFTSEIEMAMFAKHKFSNIDSRFPQTINKWIVWGTHTKQSIIKEAAKIR